MLFINDFSNLSLHILRKNLTGLYGSTFEISYLMNKNGALSDYIISNYKALTVKIQVWSDNLTSLRLSDCWQFEQIYFANFQKALKYLGSYSKWRFQRLFHRKYTNYYSVKINLFFTSSYWQCHWDDSELRKNIWICGHNRVPFRTDLRSTTKTCDLLLSTATWFRPSKGKLSR